MSTDVTIRDAIIQDVPAIAGLLSELNQHEGYQVAADADGIAAALFASQREVSLSALVAAQGKAIVGVLLFYPGYDTLSASMGYHLADMVVTDAHQRRGIGRALVKTLAERTLVEKKEWISLTSLKANIAAQDFYTALGMTRVDVDFFAIGKSALAQV